MLRMVSQVLHLILCVGFHELGLLARFVAKKKIASVSEFHVCACFITIFIAYFLVISLRHSLVSGIYIAVVILTWVGQ
jgi:hypothetical protein